MNGQNRADVKIGVKVEIVLKMSQWMSLERYARH